MVFLDRPSPQIPEVIETESAFLCYINENHHWVAVPLGDSEQLKVARQANVDDMYCAAATIMSDVDAMKIASQMAQQGQTAMRVMMEQGLVKRVMNDGQPPGT